MKPQRTCAGCRKKFDQADLLAVTRLKNGEVIVNPDQKQKGRSVYLCKNAECFRKVRDRKGKNPLEYGLKVKIPTELWKQIEDHVKKS